MAAIIDIRTGAGLAQHLSAEELAHGPNSSRFSGPRLRVLHGGKSLVVRQRRRVFLMRRVVALLVVSCAVIASGLLVRAVMTSTANPLTPVAAPAANIDPAVAYFVHSGDSLWTLAERVAPQEDPRDVVDQIVRLNLGQAGFTAQSPLRVGQSLRLPERKTS
ncbi:MAG: LysM domain-containing protein [Actinomycetes bacterium]